MSDREIYPCWVVPENDEYGPAIAVFGAKYLDLARALATQLGTKVFQGAAFAVNVHESKDWSK